MSSLPRERQRMAHEWSTFLAQVVPAGAGDGQISDTRSAFFGGAIAAINLYKKFHRAGDLQSRADLLTELIEFGEDAERIAEAHRKARGS